MTGTQSYRYLINISPINELVRQSASLLTQSDWVPQKDWTGAYLISRLCLAESSSTAVSFLLMRAETSVHRSLIEERVRSDQANFIFIKTGQRREKNIERVRWKSSPWPQTDRQSLLIHLFEGGNNWLKCEMLMMGGTILLASSISVRFDDLLQFDWWNRFARGRVVLRVKLEEIADGENISVCNLCSVRLSFFAKHTSETVRRAFARCSSMRKLAKRQKAND